MEISELFPHLPVQDMPYLPDGTLLDLVLNPLVYLLMNVDKF
jgi:DNA-directed RNA polymerase beta subunit